MLNDPMALNTIMGTYTYFANPLGLAAIAVPGVRRADGLSSSVCFVSKGGTDLALLEHAHVFAKRLE
jgi:allophanate hydrolase